jgi:nucleoside-diphosphate-sugar epimerase
VGGKAARVIDVRVLVTGAGGFVGFRIAKMLRARGDDVRSIARSAYPKLDEIGVQHVRGDLVDKRVVRDAVDGMDAVVHVAAKAGGMWGDASDYEKSNVDATQNVIDACIERGVERLVFTSTPSVASDGGDAQGANESLPYASTFLHAYGRTKAEAERRVLKANASPHKKGPGVLLTCALRPHLVIGDGDPHLLPRFVARAKAGRLAWIGGGRSLVDVTYVDNAAHAHLLALDALGDQMHKPAGKPYFISQGNPVQIATLLNGIFRGIGLREVNRSVPMPVAYAGGALCEVVWSMFPLKSDPPMTRFVAKQLGTSHYFDLSAARRDLGYETIVDDDEMMRRIIAWLKGELAAGRL